MGRSIEGREDAWILCHLLAVAPLLCRRLCCSGYAGGVTCDEFSLLAHYLYRVYTDLQPKERFVAQGTKRSYDSRPWAREQVDLILLPSQCRAIDPLYAIILTYSPGTSTEPWQMPLTGVVNVTLEYRPRVPLEGGYTSMAQVRMFVAQHRKLRA